MKAVPACLLLLITTAAAQEVPLSAFAPPRWNVESAALESTRDARVPAGTTRPASPSDSGCAGATLDQLGSDANRYGQGLLRLPRNIAQPGNLQWELPVAAATIVMIQAVDTRATRQLELSSGTTAADNASNALLGAQFGVVALTYLVGCTTGREHARHAGFAAMEAGGYAIAADLLLKAAFNREYPTTGTGEGRFWHGGKSFPSGHAATTWAIAAAIAHQYPNNRWIKWTAYAAATGVSALRVVSLKHFPSDLVVGGTLGYVTGAYIGAR